MEWREADGLRWLEASLPGATAAFTTRLGGVSESPFDALNLGILTDDDRDVVVANRRRLASALGFAPDALWFPPLIETLIAATIVFMALENIVGITPGRRWIYAFGFGLIHGFGFSFALREQLQFAGDHLVTSLPASLDHKGRLSIGAWLMTCARKPERSSRNSGTPISRCGSGGCGWPTRATRCRRGPRSGSGGP